MRILESYDVQCPSCTTNINTSSYLVLRAQNSRGQRGVVLLSQKLGDYSFEKSSNFKVNKGDIIDFSCPICHYDFTSSKNEKFSELVLKVSDYVSFEVLFSRVAGIHNTYIINEDYMESFGDNPPEFEEVF